MRTKGAVNRPKFLSARLSDLNRIFGPDTMIKVSIDYKIILLDNGAGIDVEERQSVLKTQEVSESVRPRIEVKKVKFN